MDTLHTILRALGRERKSQSARITTFRTLVDQLEQSASRTARRRDSGKRGKPAEKRIRRP